MLQVLIIGAGPTGLALALELVRRKIAVRIVDKAFGSREKYDSRAIGTHARTMEIFERLGVLEQMLATGLRWRGFNFFQNSNRIGRLAFDLIDSKFNFALVLPQAETERILREKLESLGVGVEYESELTVLEQNENFVRAALTQSNGEIEHVDTAFLIGCDGARSATRKLLNLDFLGKRLQGSYLIDCEIDWQQQPLIEGNTFFETGWRLIVGQLPENRYRVVANLPRNDVRFKNELPTIESMQSFVDHFDLKMRLKNPTWASTFFLNVKRTERMRVGRAFLAGDAAHNVCPNAGQGMNAGIHDAFNLAWKIDLTLKGKASERLLDTYESERLPVIKNLLRASENFENLMTLKNPLATRLRNWSLPLACQSKTLQAMMVNQIAGLSINYKNKFAIDDENDANLSASQSAFRAPDVQGVAFEHKQQRLFEIWKTDDRHQLLIFGVNEKNEDDLTKLARRVENEFGELVQPFLVKQSNSLNVNRIKVLFDADGEMHKKYAAKKTSLVLIRPDGYVAFRSKRINFVELQKSFKQTFKV